MTNVYLIAGLYLLGVAFAACAWIDRRRIRDDKVIIADWYRQVVQLLADAEKAATVATAAAGRVTGVLTTIQRPARLPDVPPASHPGRGDCQP